MNCIVIDCCNMSVLCCFKQKTAYEMRISDWSSDVCSSDLAEELKKKEEEEKLRKLVVNVSVRCDQTKFGESLFIIGDWIEWDATRAIELHTNSDRSEERSVGKECVSTCMSRRSL